MKLDDWRIRDQKEYLMGVSLIRKSFKSNLPKILMPDDDPRKYKDHEHCNFCWHKFEEECRDSEDCSTSGYCTKDEQIWICENCYNDFRKEFNWELLNQN